MTEKVSGDGSTIVNPSTMPEEGSVVNRPYTVSRDESGKKNPSLPSIKNVDPSTMQADGLASTHLPTYPPSPTYPPTPLPTYILPEEGSVVNRPYTVSEDKSGMKNPSLPSFKNIVEPSTRPEDGSASTHLPSYPPSHLPTYTHLPPYPPTHLPIFFKIR